MLAEQVQQHETVAERFDRIRRALQTVPGSKVIEAIEAINAGRSDSICWDCANCTPGKCEWAAELKPVWSKAIRVNSSGQALGPYAYRVQECSFFEKEEGP